MRVTISRREFQVSSRQERRLHTWGATRRYSSSRDGNITDSSADSRNMARDRDSGNVKPCSLQFTVYSLHEKKVVLPARARRRAACWLKTVPRQDFLWSLQARYRLGTDRGAVRTSKSVNISTTEVRRLTSTSSLYSHVLYPFLTFMEGCKISPRKSY